MALSKGIFCLEGAWEPKLLKAISVKPVFTSLERDYPSFVRRLGLRIATTRWATGRRIAEAVAPSLAA